MEPPIKDPPRRGHNSNNLSTKVIASNVHFPILLIHFVSLKSRQPLYKRQNGWPQRVLYPEVPLKHKIHF